MKEITLASLIDLLKRKNLLADRQAEEIIQKSLFARSRESIISKRGDLKKEKEWEPDPIELIASMNLQIYGRKGEYISEEKIYQAVAEEVGLEYLKIDPLKLDASLISSTFSRPFAKKNMVIPLVLEDDTLTIGVCNPFNKELIDNIERITRCNIKVVISSKSDIVKIINEYYGFRTSVEAAERMISQDFDLSNLEQYFKMKTEKEIEASDQHIIKAVEYLLRYAFDQRASDIHIEPKREESIVRLRIDGILHPVQKIPKIVHNAIISRVKILSRMDISEKRRPQDGRIKTDYKGKDVELRISMLPVAFGEKVVMRIFDPDVVFQDLRNLGFFNREYKLFKNFISKPHGIILVTGPTGSGKTTTLYSALKTISTPEINIITIEDPIEMIYEEFNQIAVQPAIDVTFANTLRTILRQDPDVVMVGEIRDLETAANAIQASLTGHLVLSTLHTNDAPSAITRLIDLGIEPFLISSTILGIIAQRLVRKICPHCSDEKAMTQEECKALRIVPKDGKTIPVKFGKGCIYCRNTGYLGRTGLFEIMDINPAIDKLICDKIDAAVIRKAAKESGMITLRECGIKKIVAGETTASEVLRVTME